MDKGANLKTLIFIKTKFIIWFFVVLSVSGCLLITTKVAFAGETYYIAPTGDNITGNGSKGNPWATLTKAEASISAGDTVYCRGGTYLYHPRVDWNVVGKSTSPITVKAYTGETPVFSSPGSGLFIAVRGAGWVTFDGLEVNGYKNAFNTRGLPYVDDTADTVTDYAENITIRNCYVHDTKEHGFYISAGSKNIVINNNIIEDTADFGIHNWHNPGADGLEIYNNILINCFNNFAVGAWDGKKIKIYNNTVIGGLEGLSIYQNSTPSNYKIIVKNNILYLPTHYVIHERYGNGSANLTSDNNIFYKPSGTFAWWEGAKVATLSAWQSTSGGDANSINSDPLFINSATFRLKSSSPAINTGTSSGAPAYDYGGTNRPQGAGVDIGAYEYTGGTPTSTSCPSLPSNGIMDNGSQWTSKTGSWSSSGGADPYGGGSLFSKDSGGSYEYCATGVSGSKGVYLWWTEYGSRCTSVHVEIYDGSTSIDTVYVNQQANGGKWNYLGTYSFSGKARVVVRSGGGCSTSADACKIISGSTPTPTSTSCPSLPSNGIMDNGSQWTSKTG
ncbi:MAG: hypothetical protein GY797_33230, partial [Deltaproteobacteria bacterium]|nr:hypothetical protein [Deltaproteobacteria bacterium]